LQIVIARLCIGSDRCLDDPQQTARGSHCTAAVHSEPRIFIEAAQNPPNVKGAIRFGDYLEALLEAHAAAEGRTGNVKVLT